MKTSAEYKLHQAPAHGDPAVLERLEEQKAQFIRVVVHELKAPVAAAKMLIDALRFNDALSNSPAASVVDRIAVRIGRMSDLIGDLLDLARAKSCGPLGEVAVIDLRADTERVCESYREQAEHKGLVLRVNLPDEPACARIDARSYQLVLSNLVSNAVKYTSSGAVTVSLRQQDGRAVLEVSDTGMGIPAADMPKMFSEFFRASNAKASDIEGSGVGLAGAKRLVERFDGKLSLRTSENEGSTFTVRFPGEDQADGRWPLSRCA